MRAVVVIPARYGSSRFPGKPLVPILGKPMIVRVAELSAAAVGGDATFVATDDGRIADVVESAGFSVVMTGSEALTGTDRLAEAAAGIEADIYLNVQGDEPLLNPEDIRRVLAAKRRHPQDIINGFCPLGPGEDPGDPNIPKVVMAEDGRLVYASRRAVPGTRAPDRSVIYHKQVCIYAFSAADLRQYRAFGRKSRLEQAEDIEILRFFEFGTTIRMIETTSGSVAVDVPADVEVVERILNEAAASPAHGVRDAGTSATA